jgi:hypothetical protein
MLSEVWRASILIRRQRSNSILIPDLPIPQQVARTCLRGPRLFVVDWGQTADLQSRSALLAAKVRNPSADGFKVNSRGQRPRKQGALNPPNPGRVQQNLRAMIPAPDKGDGRFDPCGVGKSFANGPPSVGFTHGYSNCSPSGNSGVAPLEIPHGERSKRDRKSVV